MEKIVAVVDWKKSTNLSLIDMLDNED